MSEMMSEEQILGAIAEIVREVLGSPSVIMTPQTVASDVEGWDSLNNIYIVVAVERRFKIKINTSEVEEVRNAGELVRLISRKLSAS
jgi:acyl carrier protein